MAECNTMPWLFRTYSWAFLAQVPFMIDISQSPLVPCLLALALVPFKVSEWTIPLHSMFFYAGLGAWTMIESLDSRMLFTLVLFQRSMEIGLRPCETFSNSLIAPMILLAMQTTIGLNFMPTLFQHFYVWLNALDIVYNYVNGSWPHHDVGYFEWPTVNGTPALFPKMLIIRFVQILHVGLVCVAMTKTTNTCSQLAVSAVLLGIAWVSYKISIFMSKNDY